MMYRREFIGAVAAASVLRAQSNNEWGGPVLDLHHHYRRDPASNLKHMDGVGITRSVLLTDAAQDSAAAAMPADRFIRFTSVNATRQDAIETLRAAAMAGSRGFGEMKSRVAADGPEMRRVYALAAELRVPVLLHFQEVTQNTSVGTFNTGIVNLPALLKEYPNTIFIGHADAFWANISAEVPGDIAYPTGSVKRGGLTDRMLADYPNLYGDLAANSGHNALTRDREFAADFVARHQDKLMFGSDCFCEDGSGKGQNNPLPSIVGKCVARETLSALKRLSSPEVFRKIVWSNAVTLLKISG